MLKILFVVSSAGVSISAAIMTVYLLQQGYAWASVLTAVVCISAAALVALMSAIILLDKKHKLNGK